MRYLFVNFLPISQILISSLCFAILQGRCFLGKAPHR